MASERFGARTAPAGLALVQDLVNTRAIPRYGSDLLTDSVQAQRWLQEAGGEWARARDLGPPRLSLPDNGTQALRELRTTVHTILGAPADPRSPHPQGIPGTQTRRTRVDLVSDDGATMAMVPTGTGSDWLASAVWMEIFLAQQTGDWNRLKVCREPLCRSAFYDASRNGSGVWHNVRTCGNVANLRASRYRRKTHSAPPDSDEGTTGT